MVGIVDYELGAGNPPQKYWEYSSSKTLHLHYKEIYEQVKNNTIWTVFQQEFSKVAGKPYQAK